MHEMRGELAPNSEHDAANTASSGQEPTSSDASPKQLFENSGACLQPLEPARGDPEATDLPAAAKLDPKVTEVVFIESESVSRSRLLSMHKDRNGNHILSLIKIVRATARCHDGTSRRPTLESTRAQGSIRTLGHGGARRHAVLLLVGGVSRCDGFAAVTQRIGEYH
jgi:hypothetical protein